MERTKLQVERLESRELTGGLCNGASLLFGGDDRDDKQEFGGLAGIYTEADNDNSGGMNPADPPRVYQLPVPQQDIFFYNVKVKWDAQFSNNWLSISSIVQRNGFQTDGQGTVALYGYKTDGTQLSWGSQGNIGNGGAASIRDETAADFTNNRGDVNASLSIEGTVTATENWTPPRPAANQVSVLGGKYPNGIAAIAGDNNNVNVFSQASWYNGYAGQINSCNIEFDAWDNTNQKWVSLKSNPALAQFSGLMTYWDTVPTTYSYNIGGGTMGYQFRWYLSPVNAGQAGTASSQPIFLNSP